MPCNSRCTHAKGDLCRCECQGANHGIYAEEEDLEKNKEEEAITNIPLFEEEEIINKEPRIVQKKITDFKEVNLPNGMEFLL